MRIVARIIVCLAIVATTNSVQAQVVQLPTFRSFSVSTTVSVPDRGAAYLGGVTRGNWSSSSHGVPGLSHVPGAGRLFKNRSIASSVSSSHGYASATIIDHAEMDRMVLAEAAARRGGAPVSSEVDRRAAYLSEFVAKHPKVIATQPKAQRQNDRLVLVGRTSNAVEERKAELAIYLERAERAERLGKLGPARCNYDVLRRRGNDEQKALAIERLAALSSPEAATKLASRGD